MKRVLVTGGTGIVGRFIVENLNGNGYHVTVAGRSKPIASQFSIPVEYVPLHLDPAASFDDVTANFDILIHAGFSHVPGHYRGGEGDDVPRFWRQNFLATLLLFQAAERARIKRAIFLSSRAVYGNQKPGVVLEEDMACHPDTHYGAIKLACEKHLTTFSETSRMAVSCLRVTGVYASADGFGKGKWGSLIEDYLQGKTIEPRCGGEVHGMDVARAVRMILEHPDRTIRGQTFNISDLLLDRRDLLTIIKSLTGCKYPLPPGADASAYNIMSVDRIASYGWKPGGQALLQSSVAAMLQGSQTTLPERD